VAAPSLEFIESKIVEIFRQPISAEDAANDALAFLDTMDSKLVSTFVSLGEAGVMNLFQTRPVLKPATVNMPRLGEFVKAFFRLHGEMEAENKSKPN